MDNNVQPTQKQQKNVTKNGWVKNGKDWVQQESTHQDDKIEKYWKKQPTSLQNTMSDNTWLTYYLQLCRNSQR